MLENYWFSVLVTLAVWLTPMPQYAEGKLVYYGSQRLIEANAEYRGYDLSPYYNRCGVSALSPSDLGKIVWLRKPGGSWYGPCLTVDVAARHHYARAVYYVGEVVEVSDRVRDRFGFVNGVEGEVWVGACPPRPELELEPAPYNPPLEIDGGRLVSYSMYPYPSQELPINCNTTIPARR